MVNLIVKTWVFPNTILGLMIGYVGVWRGDRVQRVRGCWEFHGDFVRRILEFAPIGKGGAMALTLGHSILGQTEAALEITRDHEHVHVRQYERWGPFFIPAYFIASGIAWLKGRDAYRDNVFEIEAYRSTR